MTDRDPRPQGRPPIYEWDRWIWESLEHEETPECKEGVRKLIKEKDFPTAEVPSFRVRAHQVAKEYGLKVKTRIDGDTVYLEFYAPRA